MSGLTHDEIEKIRRFHEGQRDSIGVALCDMAQRCLQYEDSIRALADECEREAEENGEPIVGGRDRSFARRLRALLGEDG